MGKKSLISAREKRLTSYFNKRIQQSQITTLEAKQKFGYKNDHHLIQEKVAPESVQRLATLLQLPRYKGVRDKAIEGSTFEDCIGIIAAFYDIALDGEYDIPEVCKMLCEVMLGNKSVVKELIPVELIEREDTFTLEPTEVSKVADQVVTSGDNLLYQNTLFMAEVGCKICNQIALCRKSNKCLGTSLEVHMEAIKDQEGMKLQ